MNLDDQALVRRLADSREEDAFRELYVRHTPAVYGRVCRLAGRAGNPSAVLHETWIRALLDLALFRGQSTFSDWLAGIALNCYRERQHRYTRVESLDALLIEQREMLVEDGPIDEARVSVQPPDGLEDELVTALRARGLLRPRRVTALITMAGRVADRLHIRRRAGGNAG